MKNDHNDATTHLNNKPSDMFEGLKIQLGGQLQAHPHKENNTHDSGKAFVAIRFPSSPGANLYLSDGVNSLKHQIRQLLCFKVSEGAEIDSIYFDLVKDLQTGALRIRLDWRWAPCWQDLEHLECESISAAIVSLIKEKHLESNLLSQHCVVNCAPDLLHKSQVAKIIDAGLLYRPEIAAITLSEFMETRYEEDESEYGNEQIYTRVF